MSVPRVYCLAFGFIVLEVLLLALRLLIKTKKNWCLLWLRRATHFFLLVLFFGIAAPSKAAAAKEKQAREERGRKQTKFGGDL